MNRSRPQQPIPIKIPGPQPDEPRGVDQVAAIVDLCGERLFLTDSQLDALVERCAQVARLQAPHVQPQVDPSRWPAADPDEPLVPLVERWPGENPIEAPDLPIVVLGPASIEALGRGEAITCGSLCTIRAADGIAPGLLDPGDVGFVFRPRELRPAELVERVPQRPVGSIDEYRARCRDLGVDVRPTAESEISPQHETQLAAIREQLDPRPGDPRPAEIPHGEPGEWYARAFGPTCGRVGCERRAAHAVLVALVVPVGETAHRSIESVACSECVQLPHVLRISDIRPEEGEQ